MLYLGTGNYQMHIKPPAYNVFIISKKTTKLIGLKTKKTRSHEIRLLN